MKFQPPTASVLGLLVSLLVSACAYNVPRPSSKESIESLSTQHDLEAVVNSLVQPLIDMNVNVGTVVGIIAPNMPEAEHIFIYENKNVAMKEGHLTRDSLFQIGSVSKVFTTALLARLNEEGRVTLDEPVFKLASTLAFKSEVTRTITLSQLASHSAGLPREPVTVAMFWRMLRHFFNGANIYDQLNEKVIVDFVSSYEVRESQKGHYYYSQMGMAFLGWLLGGTDHKGYSRIIQEKILDPLELHDTVFTPSNEQLKRLATSHVGDVPGLMPRSIPLKTWDDIPEGFRPAGGYYSTPSDLMKFLRANMGLSHSEFYPALKLTHAPVNRTQKGQVGLGWFLEDLPYTHQQYIYAGGVSSGHTSFVGFVEKYKIGVVVLQNSINFDDKVGETLLDRMVGALQMAEHSNQNPN